MSGKKPFQTGCVSDAMFRQPTLATNWGLNVSCNSRNTFNFVKGRRATERQQEPLLARQQWKEHWEGSWSLERDFFPYFISLLQTRFETLSATTFDSLIFVPNVALLLSAGPIERSLCTQTR